MIKNALREYIKNKKMNETPSELGKDLFGNFKFSDVTLSKTYKEKINEN